MSDKKISDLPVASSVDAADVFEIEQGGASKQASADLFTLDAGTGVAAALANNVGSIGAVVVQGGGLGAPSSGVLTNCTNVPAAQITGVIPIANLATGTPTGSKFIRDDGSLQAIAGGGDALVANPLSQFAATTSLQFKGVISDETGSGAVVFATSPTLVTPALGTPASGTLTSCTGLPVSTGVSGLGTGVGTALAVNTGTAGAVVVNGGAAGTPSSGTLTNCTGLPVAGITASTSTALGVGSVELGHASDTTIARSGAGAVTVEGKAVPLVIASGTAALGTSAIASGALASVVTVAATGVATTDVIEWTPNADISAVTGYAPVTTGGLIIYPYPTANNVNFKVGNPTASSITPGAVTLNFRVIR